MVFRAQKKGVGEEGPTNDSCQKNWGNHFWVSFFCYWGGIRRIDFSGGTHALGSNAQFYNGIKEHLTWSNFFNTHGITSKHFLLESRLKIFQILKPLCDLCSNLSILVVYWSFFVGAAVLLQNSLIITISNLLRQAASQLMWDFLAKAAKTGAFSWWQIWPSKPQQGINISICSFTSPPGYIGTYDPNRFFSKMYIDVLETHMCNCLQPRLLPHKRDICHLQLLVLHFCVFFPKR